MRRRVPRVPRQDMWEALTGLMADAERLTDWKGNLHGA